MARLVYTGQVTIVALRLMFRVLVRYRAGELANFFMKAEDAFDVELIEYH